MVKVTAVFEKKREVNERSLCHPLLSASLLQIAQLECQTKTLNRHLLKRLSKQSCNTAQLDAHRSSVGGTNHTVKRLYSL